MIKIEMKGILFGIIIFLQTIQGLEVGAYGVHYTGSWLNDLVTLDTAATADLHLGYHLPYTSQRQYLALSPTLDLQASSLNHLTVSLLKMFKFRLELNVIGVRASPWVSFLVDRIRYSDLCAETGLDLQAAEIELRVRQVEVNDCSLGLLGSLL